MSPILLSKNNLTWILKKYPSFRYNSNKLELIGDMFFDRSFDSKRIQDVYSIKILLKAKTNSVLPQCFHIGNKIKKISSELQISLRDLHINDDDSICLMIDECEQAYFPDGFKIIDFFENILEPYLYWISFYRKYNQPPWDDYAHGKLGYLELYAEGIICFEKLKSKVSYDWNKISKIKGHHLCICNSNKKLRNCHKKIYQAIYKIKKEII